MREGILVMAGSLLRSAPFRDEAVKFFGGLDDRKPYETIFRTSLRRMKRCKGLLGEGEKSTLRFWRSRSFYLPASHLTSSSRGPKLKYCAPSLAHIRSLRFKCPSLRIPQRIGRAGSGLSWTLMRQFRHFQIQITSVCGTSIRAMLAAGFLTLKRNW